jgi:hypothetical protein
LPRRRFFVRRCGERGKTRNSWKNAENAEIAEKSERAETLNLEDGI